MRVICVTFRDPGRVRGRPLTRCCELAAGDSQPAERTALGGRSQLRRVDEHQDESHEDSDRKEQEERKGEFETAGKSLFHSMDRCSA